MPIFEIAIGSTICMTMEPIPPLDPARYLISLAVYSTIGLHQPIRRHPLKKHISANRLFIGDDIIEVA
jgi:hypothetical protein